MSGVAPRTAARRIGNYVLGRRIGAGGMAAVFAARQQGPVGFGRLVAVKVMSTALLGDAAYEALFLREAGISLRLEHRNVVRVYEVGEADGTLFIAMEFVHGVSVRELSDAGPLPLTIALRIVGDTCRALQAAHDLTDAQGEPLALVHQDVTPHNLMVTYDGVTKLLDFGVARIGSMDASRTDTIRGKPAYLAPEQIAGRRIDRRTDVFALGIVLYELCTGERLFARNTPMEMYKAITECDISAVHEGKLLPGPIVAVCRAALSRDRDARPADARALGEALALARRELGLEDTGEEELSTWVRRVKPPAIGLLEIEREIIEGRASGAGAVGEVSASEIADMATQAAPNEQSDKDSGVRSRAARERERGRAREGEREREDGPDSGEVRASTAGRATIGDEPVVPMERSRGRVAILVGVILAVAALIVVRVAGLGGGPGAGPAASASADAVAIGAPSAVAQTAAAIDDSAVAAPSTSPPPHGKMPAWSTSAASSEAAPPASAAPSASAAPVTSSAAPSPSASSSAVSKPTRIGVRSTPYGALFLDGVPIGNTPQRLDVSPGTHTIIVRLQDGRQQSATVSVAEGETKFVPINF